MTDYAAIATAYITAWNEENATQRQHRLAAAFATDATYRDPLMAAPNRDGIGDLIAGVHQRFPGFRFALLGKPDGYGDTLRFSWALGPDGVDAPIEGTDFVTLADGRIQTVTGFLDKVPAA